MSLAAVDVSNNNPITLDRLKASGAHLLICKATEGDYFKDATLASHRQIAKQAGVPFGSYLFLHPDSKGDEAAYYLDYAKPKPHDLQPIIDAEVLTQGAPALAKRVHACATELERHGYQPILYASSSVWLNMAAAVPAIKRLRVWEAQYPGRYTRWSPTLARLRARLQHGAHVSMWQWTQWGDIQGRQYDLSRVFDPVNQILIPKGAL